MKHLDIQFMFWAQAVTPVAGLIMLTTITPMLNSFGYINLSYAYTTCGPFIVLISKIIITYISDKYIHEISRMTFSLILSIGSAIFLLFAIFFDDTLVVITIAFLVSITAGDFSFGMIPTALTESIQQFDLWNDLYSGMSYSFINKHVHATCSWSFI